MKNFYSPPSLPAAEASSGAGQLRLGEKPALQTRPPSVPEKQSSSSQSGVAHTGPQGAERTGTQQLHRHLHVENIQEWLPQELPLSPGHPRVATPAHAGLCEGHTATLPPKLASRPILVTGTFRSRARSLS